MNKTLTQEQRISIVRYRIESAENTLAEVETHRANGDYDDFFNHSIETVDELMPDAKIFIQTIKDWVNMWLIEQEY
jgi:uncharacterized protein (UPF0332 family)